MNDWISQRDTESRRFKESHLKLTKPNKKALCLRDSVAKSRFAKSVRTDFVKSFDKYKIFTKFIQVSYADLSPV
jgi:hypothetical protein